MSDLIVFDNVSKFYGEVLGVNRVTLSIEPGVTSLVGPNGSGKTTLMNLVTGLIHPTRGSMSVRGLEPSDPERFFRQVGYATQYDAFPRGVTGYEFVESFLRVHGIDAAQADALANAALERVGMQDARDKRVAAYSKGMRQRIRLAQAISHQPAVLVLDEPLNGLDPMARAEVIELFTELGGAGMHVLISSHILHEVDMISDRVILLNGGYIVAEGEIEGVRTEMTEHPVQVLVRCDRPSDVASRLFAQDHVTEIKIHEDRGGLSVRTRDGDRLHLLLNRIVVEDGMEVEAVSPADDDVQSVYQYLIGNDGGGV